MHTTSIGRRYAQSGKTRHMLTAVTTVSSVSATVAGSVGVDLLGVVDGSCDAAGAVAAVTTAPPGWRPTISAVHDAIIASVEVASTMKRLLGAYSVAHTITSVSSWLAADAELRRPPRWTPSR